MEINQSPTLPNAARRWFYQEILAGVLCPLWISPLGWYLAYRPWAVLSWMGIMLIQIELVFVILILAATGIVILAPLWFFSKVRRQAAARLWMKCAVFTAAFVGGMVMGLSVQHRGVQRVTSGAEPLVRAIQAFEFTNNRPPTTLNELVPDYLPAIPRTGIGAFPTFRYITGEPDQYDGNTWALDITPPCHILGFDKILYFPLQNYPSRGYGGWLRRVGTWAYVNE